MSHEELYAKFDKDMTKRTRLMRFLLVLDQMFNVVIWDGSQDETISSHIHRRKEKNIANWFDKAVCWVLTKFESEHCMKSVGE